MSVVTGIKTLIFADGSISNLPPFLGDGRIIFLRVWMYLKVTINVEKNGFLFFPGF